MDDMRMDWLKSSIARTTQQASAISADVERQFQQRKEETQLRDNAILQTAELLSELSDALKTEREERQKADLEQSKLTIRWNRINLAVGITGIVVGAVSTVIALVAQFV